MALITPIGSLDKLNLESHVDQEAILNYDKHQMLEGMTVEVVVERYFNKSAEIQSTDIIIMKAVETGKTPAWCIWPRKETKISTDVISSLLKRNSDSILYCSYDAKKADFMAKRLNHDINSIPIQEYLSRLRSMDLSQLNFRKPAQSVRDPERMREGYWGNLRSAYAGRFSADVMLPRIFKNFAIQPFFKWAWDVDRIALHEGQLWQIELKHKYPWQHENELGFGINRGQLNLIYDLALCGIKTLHLIMVKPYWTDKLSPGQIHHKPDLWPNVLFIGKILDIESINLIKKRLISTSSKKTSFTGRSNLNFYPVYPDEFHLLGTYNDAPDLVLKNITDLLSGSYQKPVTNKNLLEARLFS